jgi:hypothetical protein
MTDDEWARHRDLTVLHLEFLHTRAAFVVVRDNLLRQLANVTEAIDDLDRHELLRLQEALRDLEGEEEIYPLRLIHGRTP